MTIVVGVATPEGLVLASDSRTTRMGEERHHRIASDNAQKVFAMGSIGIAAYGDAFIGEDTIAGVIDKFAAQCDEVAKDDVAACADSLGEFVDKRYREAHGDSLPGAGEYALGFLVAGYDRGTGIGQIVEIVIPGPDTGDTAGITTATGGVSWRGQTGVIRRLLFGVDWDALAGVGADIPAEVQGELRKLSYQPNFPIALQDGLDYAAFLVRTTIDMERFTDGIADAPGSIPTCGGPMQLLAIERSRLTWVESLDLYSPTRGAGEGGMAS